MHSILSFYKTEKQKIFIYLITTLFSSLLPIYLSLQLSTLLNQLPHIHTNISYLFILIIIYIVSFFISNYLSIQLISLYKSLLYEKTFNLILLAYKKILYKNVNSTALSQRLVDSCQEVASFYLTSFVNFIITIPLFIYIFYLLFNTNLIISLMLIGVIGMLFLLQLFLKKKMFNKKKELIELSSLYFESIDTFIKNIEHVKYNHLFNEVYQRVFNVGKRFTLSSLSLFNIELIKQNLISLLNYLFIALFILFSKDILLGQVFLMVSLLTQLFNHVTQMNGFVDSYYRYKASKEELNKVELLIEKDTQKHIIDSIDKIEVINLVTQKQHCEAIHATFTQNEVYLIVGDNGIGKSTFFNTLLGMELDYQGMIKINGFNLLDIDIHSLFNKQLIYMDQHCDLLEYIDSTNSTITDSKGELQKAFIAEHLDMPIKNSLILLDEPTASLDTESKHRLIEKMNQLKSHHIIIIISHDPFILNQPYQKVRF